MTKFDLDSTAFLNALKMRLGLNHGWEKAGAFESSTLFLNREIDVRVLLNKTESSYSLTHVVCETGAPTIESMKRLSAVLLHAMSILDFKVTHDETVPAIQQLFANEAVEVKVGKAKYRAARTKSGRAVEIVPIGRNYSTGPSCIGSFAYRRANLGAISFYRGFSHAPEA